MPCHSGPPAARATVDVWLAPPAARSHFDAAALTEAQRALWAGLRSARRRLDFEVSRALCQAVAPAATPARSVSHSHGYAAVATTTHGTVGVDVEQCVPRDGARLAAAAFTPREAALVAARPSAAERLLAFYEIWVLKEACTKALGLTLTDVLQRTDFAAAIAGDVAAVGPDLGRTQWRAWVFAPGPDLRVAVFHAATAPTVEIRTHDWPAVQPQSWAVVQQLESSVTGATAGVA